MRAKVDARRKPIYKFLSFSRIDLQLSKPDMRPGTIGGPAIPYTIIFPRRMLDQRRIAVMNPGVEKGSLVAPFSAGRLDFVAKRGAPPCRAVAVNIDVRTQL